jgi:hypothetical protein
MTSNSRIDAFGQSHVELGDIVARVRWHPFGHPAIFGGNRQIGECRVISPRPFKVPFLALQEAREVAVSWRSPRSLWISNKNSVPRRTPPRT